METSNYISPEVIFFILLIATILWFKISSEDKANKEQNRR